MAPSEPLPVPTPRPRGHPLSSPYSRAGWPGRFSFLGLISLSFEIIVPAPQDSSES